MVKKLLYLLSEGFALLYVDLIPKSRKQEDIFLEEFITYLWLKPLCESFKICLKGGGTDLWPGISVHSAGRFGDSFNSKAHLLKYGDIYLSTYVSIHPLILSEK